MVMISTATVQMLFQTIIGILMVTTWFDTIVDDPDTATPIQFLLWVHNVLSGALAIAYGSLTVFHIYLLVMRMGTYCWLLRGKEQRMRRRRKSKEVVLRAADSLQQIEERPAAADDAQAQALAKEKEEWLKKYGDDDDNDNTV